MVKQLNFTYRGINQTTTKSKHSPEFYFDALNIKILATSSQSSGSVTNEMGNELVLTIPTITIDQSKYSIKYLDKVLIYNSASDLAQDLSDGFPTFSDSQKIINITETREGLVLFTTDETMDCIWEVKNIFDDSFDIELLYLRNMEFTINRPIQSLFNYENENIQKIYWVDGVHQIRNINIRYGNIAGNEPLIDLSINNLNFVGEVDFSQPMVTGETGGGSHTSGMIQYAYNLYRLNGSQTTLSPFSDLYSLDKGSLGGGEVNEVVGVSPIVSIADLDTRYTHIKVYAIKYTSLNQDPSVSLIDERALGGASTVTLYDDGAVIRDVSLEELVFLGSDPVVPKHIESKDNRLFISNLESQSFELPEEMDMRAYSHNSTGNAAVYDDVSSAYSGQYLNVNTTTYGNIPYTWDSVNRAFHIYKYQKNGSTIGGEGKFLKYAIVQKRLPKVEDYKLLKDGEVYRIGIQFYNKLGQKSLPKWVADFRTPDGNLENKHNTLQVTLKPEFYTWLDSYDFGSGDSKPVGYKILRANRTESDKTILAQGILNPMMINFPTEERDYTTAERRSKSEEVSKQPNFLMRTFETISPLQKAGHLTAMQFKNGDPNNLGDDDDAQNPATEVHHDPSRKRAQTYQFNAMYQMYSPEVMFSTVNLSAGLKYRTKGGVSKSSVETWFQRRDVKTQLPDQEAKAVNGVSVGFWGAGGTNPATVTVIQGTRSFMQDRGLVYNPNQGGGTERTAFTQWYREFDTFKSTSSTGTGGYKRDIYGAPEITERGAGETTYNNDSSLKYKNTLEGTLTDAEDQFKDEHLPVVSINSWGAKAITFVLGGGGIRPHQRPLIEQLYTSTNLGDPSVALIGEIVMDDDLIYAGNIYGGNTYEDKKRTQYLEIGSYTDITDNTIQIDSPGDTYVQMFKFTRISKTETEIYQYNVNQMTEIVQYPVETTIDLKNRNDESKASWDTVFQPRYETYHKYNTVYSQQPLLTATSDTDFTFRRINNFDTRIQASRLKIPNESIDSWTDILANETIDLDGKYGPINGLINFNDNIFALQDKAVALVSINPRVIVNSGDGIPTELGTGQVLDDYVYQSTLSGSINKWSIVATQTGFYYYDALNKEWMKYQGQIRGLGDVYGLSTFLRSANVYTDLKVDNPLIRQGVSTGYDPLNNDVFLTLHQGDKSFTLCWNEKTESFVSFHSYLPSIYVNKGAKFLSTNPELNSIYEHGKGEFNRYYGQYFDSSITLLMNPPENDNIFNNIIFKSEMYDSNENDLPTKTLTHIEAFNEYQRTAKVPLILNKNVNRKFRMWRASIPRALENGNPSLNMMRGNWIKLKLSLENTDNKKMILHDVGLYYTPYLY